MAGPSQAERVFCAIDTVDRAHAVALARALAGTVGGVKLGKAFFTAHGPQGVAEVAAAGLPVFLDLKYHDIPNTVADAVRAACALRPAMLTVHAAGGAAMMRAAAEAARAAGAARPLVLAVTVLTSLDADDLASLGVGGGVARQVGRLAELAQASGLDGAVCGPGEIAPLRARFGAGFKLVVPGIRPRGVEKGDQKRVMTPDEALALGADYLVIGRPITAAADPAAAARAIVASLSEAA